MLVYDIPVPSETQHHVSSLRCLLAGSFIAWTFLFGASLSAQAPDKAEEYRVKAAFLFHFAQLVEWPPEALGNVDAPMTICTTRDDPFHGALEAATQGKTIGPRPLQIRHAASNSELKGCQIIFIPGEDKQSQALLTSLKDEPVLTVGESDGFLDHGGMIDLAIEDNRVRFSINLQAAQRARLNFSSRLLILASRVIGNRKPG